MKPEQNFNPIGFAEKWWELIRLVNNFEDHILCLGAEEFDFHHTTTDSYDSSIEIKGASPKGIELTEGQKKLFKDCGFSRCWICYEEGGEKYYTF